MSGCDRLLQDINEKSIFFDPTYVPGVEGNIAGEKLARLSARGVYLAQPGSRVIVTSPAAFDIAHSIRAKLQGISIDGLGEFDIQLQSGTKITDTNTEPYGYFGQFFGSNDLIEMHSQRIRWSEFFNNKVRFFKWIYDSGFIHLVPPTQTFENKEELARYLSVHGADGSWVKAGIGASGVGSWKIGTQGNHCFTKEKLEDFDKNNKVEMFFSEDGSIVSQNNTGVGVSGKSIEMGYIIQSEAKGEEYSLSFFIGENETQLITQTKNIAVDATHQGNYNVSDLPHTVIEEIKKVAEKMRETGYRGAVGFDFFYDRESGKISILEANPRHTGATTPAVFCHRVSNLVNRTLNWSSGVSCNQDSPFLIIPEHQLYLY